MEWRPYYRRSPGMPIVNWHAKAHAMGLTRFQWAIWSKPPEAANDLKF